MFVPLLSKRKSPLSRRRGGGKKIGSGGKTSGSSSTGSKTGSSSSSSGEKTTGSSSSSSKGGITAPIKSTPITSGGTGRIITGYSNGGGKVSSIPTGQLFSGRSQGGATRSQVWGTRMYGSGYPGLYTRGVSGRGFPFYFWPLVWGSVLGSSAETAYLYSEEYGRPDNGSRPGGAQTTFAFQSNSTGTTFRVVADNATTADLIADVAANCSAWLVPIPTPVPAPAPVNASAPAPQPAQVVQYYRASSVALTLDGYNNSLALASPENSTADAPLPAGTDANLLECLNVTVGLAVPLVDGSARTVSAPSSGMGLVALALVLILALLL